jgi:hypothetical protein
LYLLLKQPHLHEVTRVHPGICVQLPPPYPVERCLPAIIKQVLCKLAAEWSSMMIGTELEIFLKKTRLNYM